MTVLSERPAETPDVDRSPRALLGAFLASPTTAILHLPRPLAPEAAAAAGALDRGGFEGPFDVRDVDGPITAWLPPHPGRAALVREVERAVEAFARATGARRPVASFGVVTTDACRKLHVDFIALRLVATFAGPGTEWAPDGAVDRLALAAMEEDVERANARIVPDASRLRRCAPGDWLVLKGERWPGFEGRGAVHRSPPIEGTGARRLVLALTLPRSRRDAGEG